MSGLIMSSNVPLHWHFMASGVPPYYRSQSGDILEIVLLSIKNTDRFSGISGGVSDATFYTTISDTASYTTSKDVCATSFG